jgi:hypothetical protein
MSEEQKTITNKTRNNNSKLPRNAYFFVVLTCKEKGLREGKAGRDRS